MYGVRVPVCLSGESLSELLQLMHCSRPRVPSVDLVITRHPLHAVHGRREVLLLNLPSGFILLTLPLHFHLQTMGWLYLEAS